jgi:branched-chain amino acid transport system substrate-binding protein
MSTIINVRSISRILIIGIIAVVIVAAAVIGILLMQPFAPTPTKTEIIIGAALSLTGKYADSGKRYQEAYTLWVEEVNAQGGIYVKEYGKKLPVRLILYDDASDPTTGVNLYEKLITVDKVDLILGAYHSSIVYATSAVAEKYEYLYIEGGGVSKTIFERGFKYVFLTLPGLGYQYTLGLFQWLETLPPEKRPKTLAWIGEDSEGIHDIWRGVQQYAKNLGIEIVVAEFYPPATTDFIPLVSKAKAANAEILIGGTYFPASVSIAKAVKELDYNPKIIWLSAGPALYPDFVNALGPIADYIWNSNHFMPYPTTKYSADFVKKYRERWGRDPNYHAAGAYAACQILQQAIEATGTLNNKVLRDYVATHEFTTVFGIMKFNPDGTPHYAMLLIQYQNGKPEIIWPKELRTTEPVYPMPTWKEREKK